MTLAPAPRTPDFPDHPEDGFQIKEPLPKGGHALWTYNAGRNAWTYETYTHAISGYIYTDQVLVREESREEMNVDPSTLKNQRDINHFLDTKVAEEVEGLATEEYVNEAISRIPPPPSLDGHVTKQEFTQSQAAQDLEIAKLDDKIDQIQGKAGQGKWKYDNVNTNPRPGDFNLLGSGNIPTNRWADVAVIKFSGEDAVGHNYDFHRAVEGDVIKLGYELGPEVSYAEFQVTPGGNGIFGVVRLLGHEGTARPDWRYDVEHFSSFDPTGVATQTYVDEGDDAVKEYVDQRVDSIPEIPTGLATQAYVDAGDNAVKGYVDQQVGSIDFQGKLPGFRWKYASHATAQNLVAGEFFINSAGNVYFHTKTLDGNDLGVDTLAWVANVTFLVSVFDPEDGNSIFSMICNEIRFNNSDNRYVRVQQKNVFYKGDLKAEKAYHLSIPGFSS